MVSVNVRYVRNFAKSCAKILGNTISNIEKLILFYVTPIPTIKCNHLMIKNGIWQITYIESGKEITYSFRIGYQSMPKGFNREISLREVNEDMCQLFPDGLICPRQVKKIQKK